MSSQVEKRFVFTFLGVEKVYSFFNVFLNTTTYTHMSYLSVYVCNCLLIFVDMYKI